MWLFLVPSLLGGGDERPPAAWQALDQAVAGLSKAADEPRSFGFLVRGFATGSAVESAEDTAAADVSGFALEDVDVYFAANHGDFAWRVSADLDQSREQRSVELEDAHASWRHTEWFALTVGQFKPRVTRSGSIPASELLFRERTFLGAAFDAWDRGFEIGGHYDQFDYWLALANGASGTQKDHFYSGRVEWAFNDTAIEDREGARGASRYLRILLGASLFADDGPKPAEGQGYAADLAFTFGPYAFHGEWADLRDFARTIDVFNGHTLDVADGQPLAGTLSRRVGDELELAVRYQRADEADSTTALGLGANWSPGGGPLRFLAEVEFVDGDQRDFSLFSIGASLGSSGLTRPFAAGTLN
jgi:hypothetical protein